jgi:threonine/homoserine/homoserine lactone efflux protein
MLEAFFIAWVGVVAAQASPGPNMMAVAAAAFSRGRASALLVVSGIASGTLVWAAATAAGLGALFDAVPVLLTVLKFVGGAYLLFIAVKGLIAAFRGTAGTDGAAAGRRSDTGLAAWRRGFFVVMTNPKAALMWSALATFLFGAGLNGWQVFTFGPVVAVSAALVYGTYGLLFSTGPAAAAYDRFTRWIEGLFGTVFGTIGTVLVIDGLRDVARQP